ncbi:MAG: DUF2946 family protein [Steroidobacteraceae bacterium]
MEDWVLRAMKRWPNVPALFGWLSLDRRGRWLIQGEVISHPLIVQAINRNYAPDEHGRWFFQNGPQRGYMKLEYAPFVLRTSEDGTALVTHSDLTITQPKTAYIDENGTMLLQSEHGAGEIAGAELEWVLELLTIEGAPITEDQIADTLSLPSGAKTPILFELCGSKLPVRRLDQAVVPEVLKFVRDPQPREGEKTSSGAQD